METKILKAGTKAYLEAKNIILNDGLVAFPTETVYGLGANAFSDKAVEKIFIAKERPNDNPLIVHLSNVSEIKQVAEITETAKKLIKAFMPGPLTLVLKKSNKISDLVTCGLDTVALRIPQNKYAVKFIKTSKVPIAAPSANVSGRPSPTLAEHVYDDLAGKIPLIIDGGACDIGIESTVIDATGLVPVILRPGKITFEDIKRICGDCFIGKIGEKAISPGTKYKHYAPECEVYLFDNLSIDKAKIFIKEKTEKNLKVLAICKDNDILNLKNTIFYTTEENLAKNLYMYFRTYEKIYDIVLIEKPDDKGLGSSVMNRLLKAAGDF